jgi:hypothetical protein
VHTEAAGIQPYADPYDRLRRAALSTKESRRFLAEAAERVEAG